MRDKDMFGIIFLCTGNRARSAMAEAFLRNMTADLTVEVASAGLLDLEPGPALADAVSACSRMGIDLTGHRSRPLSLTPVDEVNLVIGFERQHIAAAVVDAGVPIARTFLFRELIALLRQINHPSTGNLVADATGRVAAASQLRNGGAIFSVDDETADPLGRSSRVFEDLATDLYRLCTELAAGLFGVVPLRPPTIQHPLDAPRRTALSAWKILGRIRR